MCLYVVELDVLFFNNFFIDATIIWLFLKIVNKQAKIKRILISALIGAIYVCLKVFFIKFIILPCFFGRIIEGLFTYIVVPIVMLKVIYGWRRHITFKIYYTFLLVFVLTTGIASIITYNTVIGEIRQNSIKGRILVLLCACLVVKGIVAMKEVSCELKQTKLRVVIDYKGKKIEGIGLIDTGNTLIDPIYAKPVTICEDRLFDIDVRSDVKLDELQGAHLIPFRTIGNSRGMLLAIRVDCLKIYKGTNATIEIQDAIVGLYSGKLSLSNEYNIILHPLNSRK